MVSDILAVDPYDRMFVFSTSTFMLGIMQVNMRAYFKKVYGYIPHANNDRTLWIGLISCVALPMIGIFDEYNYRPIHYACAITFFSCFSLYGVLLANDMYTYRDNFPHSEQRTIEILKKNSYGIMASALAFMVSLVYYGSICRITPAFEWITAVYLLNFYTFASFANPYYDSIHDPTEKKKEIEREEK